MLKQLVFFYYFFKELNFTTNEFFCKLFHFNSRGLVIILQHYIRLTNHCNFVSIVRNIECFLALDIIKPNSSVYSFLLNVKIISSASILLISPLQSRNSNAIHTLWNYIRISVYGCYARFLHKSFYFSATSLILRSTAMLGSRSFIALMAFLISSSEIIILVNFKASKPSLF